MKERIEKQIRELKFEQEQILSIDINFDSKLDFGLNLLSNLDKFFAVMDIETKYNMIGLIFPEKLQYQKNQYQTTKINEFANTILSDNTRCGEKIKKLTAISDSQSHLVIRAGTPRSYAKLMIVNRLFKKTNPNSNDLVTVPIFELSLKMPLLA